MSEAQQQWWNLKAANFDSVLLFKVGKFYEVRGRPAAQAVCGYWIRAYACVLC